MANRLIGLKGRITILFTLLFLLCSLLFNSWNYSRIRSQIIAYNDRELLSYLHTRIDEYALNERAFRLPADDTVFRIEYDSANEWHTGLMDPAAVLPVATSSEVIDSNQRRFVTVIANDRHPGIRATMSVPDTEIKHELSNTWNRLMVTSILLAAVCAGLLYFLVHLLLRPVHRIIDDVKKFNARNKQEPIVMPRASEELHELEATITEMLKQIEQSIQQQQNFFASASHELKTPLSILRTELEVGLARHGFDDTMYSFLNNQLEEIRRLQEVVDEFLVVSQVRSRSLGIYRKEFDLSELVVRVFNRLMPIFRKKDLTTSIHFDEEVSDFSMCGDAEMVRIVLFNLIENAAKYSVPESRITCQVRKNEANGEFLMEFSNRIYQQQVETENLHMAFFRGVPLEEGSGLGLWLCDHIIKLHGGTLRVSSADHHFVVSVTLPV